MDTPRYDIRTKDDGRHTQTHTYLYIYTSIDIYTSISVIERTEALVRDLQLGSHKHTQDERPFL